MLNMKTVDSQAKNTAVYISPPLYEECQQRIFRNAHCRESNSSPHAPNQSNKGIIPRVSDEKSSPINLAIINAKRNQILEKQRLVQEAIERIQSPTSIMEYQQSMEHQSIMFSTPNMGITRRIELTDESESRSHELNYIPSRIWENFSDSGKKTPIRKTWKLR
jgi:hypothetical protein